MGEHVNGYAVVIERADDGGYGAWSPELPGCVALGDTPERAATEMRVAIRSTWRCCGSAASPCRRRPPSGSDLMAAA